MLPLNRETASQMEDIKMKENQELVAKAAYFLLACITSVPLFLAIHAYVQTTGAHEDEAVATVATGLFLATVFLGRYMTMFLLPHIKKTPNILIIVLVVLIIVNFGWLFFHADRPFVNRPALNLLLYWIPFLVMSISVGMLIKVMRSVTQNQLKEAQLTAVQSQSELNLLQSQLSPHFLFNTLNNLYGLSITQHEKIPDLLLKLSDLLRYSVYDATEQYVPLQDEIAYIDNYIEFEKIRIGDRLVLKTDIERPDDTSVKIAPMLLIVFIENAFKHSKNTTEEKIYISISIKTWGHSILFSVQNSYRKPEENEVIRKGGGLGLANVRKRLSLLYPSEHELFIENDERTFAVNLRLKKRQNEQSNLSDRR